GSWLTGSRPWRITGRRRPWRIGIKIAGPVRSGLFGLDGTTNNDTEPRKHHFLRSHFAPPRYLIGRRVRRIVRGVVMMRRHEHPRALCHFDLICDLIPQLPMEL